MQSTFVNLCYTMETHAVATMMTYFGSTDHGLGTEVDRGRWDTSSKNRLESPPPACLVGLTWIVFVMGGTRLTKAWTAIDRLTIIWKSDLIDKMKRGFFLAAVVSILLYGCTTWTLTKLLRRRLTEITQECWEQYWTRPGSNTPQGANYTVTCNQSRRRKTLNSNLWDFI